MPSSVHLCGKSKAEDVDREHERSTETPNLGNFTDFFLATDGVAKTIFSKRSLP